MILDLLGDNTCVFAGPFPGWSILLNQPEEVAVESSPTRSLSSWLKSSTVATTRSTWLRVLGGAIKYPSTRFLTRYLQQYSTNTQIEIKQLYNENYNFNKLIIILINDE